MSTCELFGGACECWKIKCIPFTGIPYEQCKEPAIFNRLRVAGTVIQTPSLLIYWLSNWVTIFLHLFKRLLLPNRKCWGAEILKECSTPTSCHISHVMCHTKSIRPNCLISGPEIYTQFSPPPVFCFFKFFMYCMSYIMCHVSGVKFHKQNYMFFSKQKCLNPKKNIRAIGFSKELVIDLVLSFLTLVWNITICNREQKNSCSSCKYFLFSDWFFKSFLHFSHYQLNLGDFSCKKTNMLNACKGWVIENKAAWNFENYQNPKHGDLGS